MKKIFYFIILTIIFSLTLIFGIDFYIKYSTKDRIININGIKEIDAIVVLGASVKEDGTLSLMLKERVDTGIEVYNHLNKLIIMSGDSTRKDYDEVIPMKNYAIKNGIDSNMISLDYAGISTYDSIYRMKHVFKLKKIVIITQKYHLYRALYVAQSLGIEAYGIDATKVRYVGQSYRDLREILARNKDFIKCIFKPKAKYVKKQD